MVQARRLQRFVPALLPSAPFTGQYYAVALVARARDVLQEARLGEALESFLTPRELQDSLNAAKEALSAARAAGNRKEEAASLNTIAQVLLAKKEPTEAYVAATEAVAILRSAGDWDGTVATFQLVVSALLAQDRCTDARRVALEALASLPDLDDKAGEASMHLALADVFLAGSLADEHLTDDDLVAAQDPLQKSVALARVAGDKHLEATALQVAAQVSLVQRNTDAALRDANAAVQVLADLEDSTLKASMFNAIADAHFVRFELKEGLAAAKEALKIFRELRQTRNVAATLNSVARAYLLLEEDDMAWRAATEAQVTYQQIGDKLGEAGSLLLVGAAHLFQGSDGDAADAGWKSYDIFHELGDEMAESAVAQFLWLCVGDDAEKKDGKKAKGQGMASATRLSTHEMYYFTGETESRWIGFEVRQTQAGNAVQFAMGVGASKE